MCAHSARAWSTNTHIYTVRVGDDFTPATPVCVTAEHNGYDLDPLYSPDGRSLLWWALACRFLCLVTRLSYARALRRLSMERAGYESDKKRVLVRDRASGRVEQLAAAWDGSPSQLAWYVRS